MWEEDVSGNVVYGAPDYEKVRKVLENDGLRNLLRSRIDVNACWYGRPGRTQFDKYYERYVEMITDYLAVYDATQEVDIDFIFDHMPAKYTEQVPYPAFGVEGDEDYLPAGVSDMRESYMQSFMNIWGHEGGFAGFLSDMINRFLVQAYTLEEAKAFNRLCVSESEEVSNNALIAQYITSEGLGPLSESAYQEALEGLNARLDQGLYSIDNEAWTPDYREQKGLPTKIQDA